MDINVNVGGTIHIVVDVPDIKKLLGIVSPSEQKVDKGEIASILNDIETDKVVTVKATDNAAEDAKPEVAEPAPTTVPVEEKVISNADLRAHLIQVRRKAASQGKDILQNTQLKEKLAGFGVETLNELNAAQVAEMYAWVDLEAANA